MHSRAICRSMLLGLVLLANPANARSGIEVIHVATPQDARPLPGRVVGRVWSDPAAGVLWRQWPGTVFETAFRGRSAYFLLGAGEVALNIVVDGRKVARLAKPAPGSYLIRGLANRSHRLRIEVVSESQAGPTGFGGFSAPAESKARTLKAAKRRIELIGDSHTVGYGNRSPTRDCTAGDVWDHTDTHAGIAGQLARRYRADIQVNAISGRGVVRNYDGIGGDPLPDAYPYLLFDRAPIAMPTDWSPQVVAIALGTNDFSTPLHPGEPWTTREELHAAFADRYVRFVQELRARHPQAYFILWTTDAHEGEIASQVALVADRLRAQGERRLAFLEVSGLSFTACHAHPSLADAQRIVRAIGGAIRSERDIWYHEARSRDGNFVPSRLPSTPASP